MNFPFFSLKPDRIDVIAGLRDRALIAETKVLLLEDIVEHRHQPHRSRSAEGRFISSKPDTRAMLERLYADPKIDRKAAIANALTAPLTAKQAFFAKARAEREMGK